MRPVRVVLLMSVALPLMGCESIAQDINDLSSLFSIPTPQEASRDALDQDDPDRRRLGTLWLSNATFGGDPPYVTMYRDYVQNEDDPLVKAVAIRALAKHGTTDDGPIIARQLEHESVQVRWEAAKGLQRIHNRAVVPAVLTALGNEDDDANVRVALATALGQYPEDRAFQGLIRALDAVELEVNIAAEESLQLLTGRDFGLDPRQWLDWYIDVPAADRFAQQQPFTYPVYERRRSWWERLAFWNPRIEEQSGPPVGLKPADQRSTYQDDDPTASESDS